MRTIPILLAVALASIAGGCRSTGDTDASHEPAWTPIFNGRDLTGWTPKFAGHPLGANHRNTFRVEDGALVVSYDEYETFDGAFGHLFHAHEYEHYRLRLEYRFTGDQTPGGPGWAFRNSGLMIHAQAPETMRREQDFPVSMEVQLLGGDGTNPRATGNLCTPGTHAVIDGALDTRHCIDSTSPTFHGDGWVALEVEVHGGAVVRHWIDGRLVFEYTEPQLDENDPDARAWLERRGGDARLRGGAIALQAESHPCAFRRIEVMELSR